MTWCLMDQDVDLHCDCLDQLSFIDERGATEKSCSNVGHKREQKFWTAHRTIVTHSLTHSLTQFVDRSNQPSSHSITSSPTNQPTNQPGSQALVSPRLPCSIPILTYLLLFYCSPPNCPCLLAHSNVLSGVCKKKLRSMKWIGEKWVSSHEKQWTFSLRELHLTSKTIFSMVN